MSRPPMVFWAVFGLVLAGAARGVPAHPSQASGPHRPEHERLMYALTIDIPQYQGMTLQEFGQQLCHAPDHGKDDAEYLATFDVDPASSTYGQAIARAPVPSGIELHHMHINHARTRVVMYDLYASLANIFDIETNPREPRFLKQVNLGEESRKFLGEVEGVGAMVGYGAPHESFALDNGNWLVVMNSVYVPEHAELHEGPPGGFVELTPDGEVVNVYPRLHLEDGKLVNGLYEGRGLFSVDYNERLNLFIHSDFATQRTYKCGVGLGPTEFGSEVVLWNFDMEHPERSTIFQKLTLPTAALSSPHAVQHRIHGMDVFYVSSFFSGVWAVYRRARSSSFEYKLVYSLPTEEGHASSHIRIAPDDMTIYVTDALGDTIHVLGIADDPLHPQLLQKVHAPQIHVVKFSADSERLYGSNGIASIIDFQFRTPPFGVHYGISLSSVNRDGTLTAEEPFLADALDEPDAPPNGLGVFFGDFVLRENAERTH